MSDRPQPHDVPDDSPRSAGAPPDGAVPQWAPSFESPWRQQPSSAPWAGDAPADDRGGYAPAGAYGYTPQPWSPPGSVQSYGGDPYGAAVGSPGGPWSPGVQPEHPQATLVLVLGILGLFVGGLTSPFAWWIGQRARREVQQTPGAYASTTSLTVGWVLGILGTVYLAFLIAMVLFMVVAFVTFAAAP